MKATYFMGHETFEVHECPIPKAKPGTVVVKNYACGVCGTDTERKKTETKNDIYDI